MTYAGDVPTQYEEVRSFTRRWAEGTLRQAARYREAYRHAYALDDCWERLDSDTLRWDDVVEASETAWVEGHLLVVAAHHMDTWHRRMLTESGSPEPESSPGLADLRNALEHMDQALFVDGEPVRDPTANRKNWALDKLARSPALYLQSKRMYLLGLLDVDNLETAARHIAGDIIDEIEAPAVDAYIQGLIDERRGK